MKKVSFWIQAAALVVITASPMAQAANEGPIGAPPNTTVRRLIAELTVRGGFAPPPGINQGVRIYSNGEVESYSHQNVTALATLTPEVATRLVAEADAAPADAELIDHQEGAPFCFDVPTGTYRVYAARGETVRIAARMRCHSFSRHDGFGHVFKRLLDGFDAL